MKFLPPEAFAPLRGYHLLPLRFRRLPWDDAQVFATSLAGDWVILPRDVIDELVAGTLQDASQLADLEARHFLARDVRVSTMAPLLSQYRTRKRYVEGGPSLHIFVVSLRCHHTCAYCQVSRQTTSRTQFDMSPETARLAVTRLFESPSPDLTVEFQGGEPLLHFDAVRAITEDVVARNAHEGRQITFVLASTLHDLTEDHLAFFRDHAFQLSTSLDGPEELHNANRPRPERDSYRRTMAGIERGRRALGDDAVSALTTLTYRSLAAPEAIVDEYVRQGFHSIVLRPLSPYGFAKKTQARTGYGVGDFLDFYRAAFDHILSVNRNGYELEEGHAALLLSQLLTPFSHGYVDLRSPTGAGFGTVVYDYDGRVYPTDEARMLAAMGDHGWCMGRVDESREQWMRSPAMQRVIASGVAESLPGCSDCAFVPLCGADPVDHYARQGDAMGHRPSSDFCAKQLGLFDLLVKQLIEGHPADRATLERWAVQPRLRSLAPGPAAVVAS